MTVRNLFITLVAALFALSSAHAQEEAKEQQRQQVEVLLVMASDSGAGIDAELKPYTETLERLFRFNSYELKDRKELEIDAPGGMSANLYGGTKLKLGLKAIQDGKLPANIDWRRGKQKLLRTMVRLNPDTPAVLGGPQAENNTGTYLLIIQWRE